MFDKMEEYRDFVALYRAGKFEDQTDFEYKLTTLLMHIEKISASPKCDCDEYAMCDCDLEGAEDKGYSEGYDDGYKDCKAGKEPQH